MATSATLPRVDLAWTFPASVLSHTTIETAEVQPPHYRSTTDDRGQASLTLRARPDLGPSSAPQHAAGWLVGWAPVDNLQLLRAMFPQLPTPVAAFLAPMPRTYGQLTVGAVWHTTDDCDTLADGTWRASVMPTGGVNVGGRGDLYVADGEFTFEVTTAGEAVTSGTARRNLTVKGQVDGRLATGLIDGVGTVSGTSKEVLVSWSASTMVLMVDGSEPQRLSLTGQTSRIAARYGDCASLTGEVYDTYAATTTTPLTGQFIGTYTAVRS
jgi:hypothetical protein